MLFHIGRHTECGHSVEHTERMASLQEFIGIPFVQGARNKENDVVNHVRIAAKAVSLGWDQA